MILLAITSGPNCHQSCTCCKKSSFLLSVHRCTACLQLPCLASLHQTFWWDCAVISEGAKPFLSTSNSSASAGNRDSSELQTQAWCPAQTAHPLPLRTRACGVAIQWCGCPLGQREQTQCTSFLLPKVVLSGKMSSASLRS